MNKKTLHLNSLMLNASKALEVKDYKNSLKFLKKIQSINNNIFEVNFNLGLINLHLENLDNSLLYLNKASTLEPNNAKVYFNMGLIHEKKQELNSAIHNFKKVIELEPNHTIALLNLGLTYKKNNEIINAEQYFLKVLKMLPKHITSFNNLFDIYDKTNQLEKYDKLLIQAKKYIDEKNLLNYHISIHEYKNKNYKKTIDILENLILEKNYPVYNLIKYGILGKCYDQLGDYDKAYYNFKTNNNLVDHYFGNNIDKNIFIKYVNQRIEFFENFKVDQWEENIEKKDFKDPIFLIGFPRSGTTLLDTILRTNQSVEVIEEKPIIKNFLIQLEKKTNNDFNELKYLDQKYINKMKNFYLQERSKFTKNTKAEIIIDKMPLNIIHVGEILRFFPNAKFIFALRNPYDCVLSCFMQQFTLNPAMKNFLNLESSAELYDLVMRLWKIYKNIFPVNFHYIKYEDIALDFNNTTKKIYKFLDLEWSKETNNFYLTARKRLDISTPSYNQITSPIYSKSINRWKNYQMNFKDAEKYLEKWVAEFNYS